MACTHPERVVLACLACVACLALASCHKRSGAPAPAPTPAVGAHLVAATREPIKLDGELDEPSWNQLGDPQTFTQDGQEARPFSQVRFLHDADTLYVGLYAADQNILSSDKFELTIGTVVIAADPLGHITPAIAGVRAGKDADGTVDQPGDQDEEWVIELAIPLAATGWNAGTPLPVRVARCDTPDDGVVRCGSWSDALRLAN